MNEEEEEEEWDDDDDEGIEDGDIVFEPDEALILALNEINDLKSLVEGQSSSILDLKEELILLKKNLKQ